MAFDDLDADEVRSAQELISGAALDAARSIAAERLVAALGSGVADPAAVVRVLLERDEADERYDILREFESRWALLVVRLLEPLISPVDAIRDARSRGVTVNAVAGALGIAHQTVYARYGEAIVLRRRNG